MTNKGQRWLPWAVGFALIVVLPVAAWIVFDLDLGWNRSHHSDLVAVIVGATAPGAAALGAAMVGLFGKSGPTRPARDEELPEELPDADSLAEEVWKEWKKQANERGISRSTLIRVKWKWPEQAVVTGGREVAVESTRFTPLPGFASVTDDELREGWADNDNLLHIYGGLRSGRLLIVGGGGSGKTAAAIFLAQAVLEHRKPLADAEKAGVPVPVLMTLRDWDPTTSQTFQEWLAVRLAKTYSVFGGGHRGIAKAKKLVESGKVAVFLDGLDEIGALDDTGGRLRRVAALKKLMYAEAVRVVVCTRTDEMAVAAEDAPWIGAAALELQPVDVIFAKKYLRDERLKPLSEGWEEVIGCLDRPESAIAKALSSPLMLTLARDILSDNDVRGLLDVARGINDDHLGKTAIENYLLDRVLPAAYERPLGERSRYSLNNATNGLKYIATCMYEEETYELAWWQIPSWAPKAPRIITTSLLFGLTLGLIFGFSRGPGAGLVAAVVAALFQGLGQAGLLTRVRQAQPQPRTRIGPPKRLPSRLGTVRWRTVLTRESLLAGSWIGLGFGIAVGLLTGLVAGFVDGLVFGLAGVLVVGFGRPGEEESPSSPLSSWRGDRNYGLVAGLGFGLVLGVVLGLTLGVGFASGFVAGLVGGLVGGLFYPKTWRTALTCGQLSLSGHTPLRLMRFLEDAYARDVLRTVGPYYQFRHASIRNRLARPGYTAASANLGGSWTREAGSAALGEPPAPNHLSESGPEVS